VLADLLMSYALTATGIIGSSEKRNVKTSDSLIDPSVFKVGSAHHL
jgi:hypothetical protein